MILLNTASLEEYSSVIAEANFDAFLTKPVRQSQLYDCLVGIFTSENSTGRHINMRAQSTSEDSPKLSARVLLAEDHPVNQEVAASMLRILACEVNVVEDGQAALTALMDQPYDIVLMDCNMPVMDGFEATSEIRRREVSAGMQRIPVVALTANALQGDRERCLAAGMDDYLSKPFTFPELTDLLERWLPPGMQFENGHTAPAAASASDSLEHHPKSDAEALDPTLDLSVLEGIRAMDSDGQGDFLQGLIEKYLNNSSTDLQNLESSMRIGDAEALGKTAHRLKSASANLGAMTLASLCKELETAGRSGQLDAAGAMLTALTFEYQRVSQALIREVA